MFGKILVAGTLLTLGLALGGASAEARGGSRASSFSLGTVRVGGYYRRSGRYVTSYDRRLPLSGPLGATLASTVGPGVVTGTPVSGSLSITAGTPQAQPDLEHEQTREEWKAECKALGRLVGSSWGFCVVTTDLLASNP